jgi:hypothetical protein
MADCPIEASDCNCLRISARVRFYLYQRWCPNLRMAKDRHHMISGTRRYAVRYNRRSVFGPQLTHAAERHRRAVRLK